MNQYLRFEVIYNTSKIDIMKEFVTMSDKLSAEVITIERAYTPTERKPNATTVRELFDLILTRLAPMLPASTIFRMHINNKLYIEE